MSRFAPRSLRTAYLVLIGVATAVALAVSAALVVMTKRIHATTESLAAAIDGVRLAQEIEVDLLLHNPVALARIESELERRLHEHLSGAKEFVTTHEEDALLRETVDLVGAYVDAAGERDRPPAEVLQLRDAAVVAAERLIEINIRQSEEARATAARWDVLASYIGYGAGGLLLVVVFALLWWVRARAIDPLRDLARAMDAYRRGHRDARAHETGPVELREIASQFNRMAAELNDQHVAQMTFLGGVAHDLRNPLHALRLAVSTLDRGPSLPEDRTRRLLGILRRQLSQLERMVGDFLDISRIEAGRLELRVARHDLCAIVERAAALFAGASPRHRLALDLPPEAIPVACDPLRIEQVIVNLLSNAIKYSPDGGPVDVAVVRARGGVVVTVRDYGVGVSDADRKRLFEPFYRVTLSREAIPGVGLGLYVVQRIVQGHGGRIEVDSAPGCGTTFRVFLPAPKSPSDPPARDPEFA